MHGIILDHIHCIILYYIKLQNIESYHIEYLPKCFSAFFRPWSSPLIIRNESNPTAKRKRKKKKRGEKKEEGSRRRKVGR